MGGISRSGVFTLDDRPFWGGQETYWALGRG
jgi:hypothetical protein